MHYHYHYALDENHVPYPVTIEEAVRLGYFQKDRDDLVRVGRTKVGPYEISTVFLIMNHAHCDSDSVLFETQVFSESDSIDDNFFIKRYTTWEDALKGHTRFVAHYVNKI